jgi:hypothetical protein
VWALSVRFRCSMRTASPRVGRSRNGMVMAGLPATLNGPVFQPGHFIPQLGKVMPIQINTVARTETKTVVRYETVEERRQAMIAKGWSPAALAALEEAMEPKFLRDMREESMREENEGQGEAN